MDETNLNIFEVIKEILDKHQLTSSDVISVSVGIADFHILISSIPSIENWSSRMEAERIKGEFKKHHGSITSFKFTLMGLPCSLEDGLLKPVITFKDGTQSQVIKAHRATEEDITNAIELKAPEKFWFVAADGGGYSLKIPSIQTPLDSITDIAMTVSQKFVGDIFTFKISDLVINNITDGKNNVLSDKRIATYKNTEIFKNQDQIFIKIGRHFIGGVIDFKISLNPYIVLYESGSKQEEALKLLKTDGWKVIIKKSINETNYVTVCAHGTVEFKKNTLSGDIIIRLLGTSDYKIIQGVHDFRIADGQLVALFYEYAVTEEEVQCLKEHGVSAWILKGEGNE